MYHIYLAPGWHGELSDPLICVVDDERLARMMAGERIDIQMPGACSKYRCYAVDEETGERLEPIPSFRCDACGELREWGEYGPIGGMEGRILECPGAAPKHLVTWMCEDCAAIYEDEDDAEDWDD